MMQDVIKNAPKSFRSILKDALLETRLALCIERIKSPTIMKSKFKKILDDTKERFDEVKDALDNVFEEYFPKFQKENNEVGFTEFTKKEASTETGTGKGVSFVKRDGHFNSSTNNNQAA